MAARMGGYPMQPRFHGPALDTKPVAHISDRQLSLISGSAKAIVYVHCRLMALPINASRFASVGGADMGTDAAGASAWGTSGSGATI